MCRTLEVFFEEISEDVLYLVEGSTFGREFDYRLRD